MRISTTAAALIALLVCGCSERASDEDGASDALANSSSPASSYEASGYSGGYLSSDEAQEEREPFDEDAARDAAEDEVASDTYVGMGSPYGCTEDCSGHEAGFRYRADNGYVGYSGDSPSFNEGGQAFEDAVEERVEEMRSDYDSGSDPDY